MDEVVNNCVSIATNRFGCCALQDSLELFRGAAKDRLVARLTENALFLAQDRYGLVFMKPKSCISSKPISTCA